jgi:hypothetical protein
LVDRNDVGEAYGFFYCAAPKQDILDLLPKIRSAVKTLSRLELFLIGLEGDLRDDAVLSDLAGEAIESGFNYVLRARCPGKTNSDTAGEVGDILNQAYQSHLYAPREPFNGALVYDDGGEYVFRMPGK